MALPFIRLLSKSLFPLLICTCSCVHAAAQADIPAAITSDSVNATPPLAMQGKGVRRIRAVHFNVDVFNDAAADAFKQAKNRMPDFSRRIEFEFFPDFRTVVAWSQVERVDAPPGLLWTGKIVDRPFSQAVLLISGTNVIANINRGDGPVYQIRTADGTWWVREVDTRNLPKESAPAIPNQ